MNEKEFLLEVLNAYSPSGKEKPVAKVLNSRFNELGFKSRIDSIGNVIAKIGTGNKTLLFLGHMDTVSGEIKVEEKNGLIYGRGSVDAKSCIVSFALAVSKSKFNNLKIILASCIEEETPHSRGGRYIIERHKPDFVVVGEPSSSSALTLGYKGRSYIEFKSKTLMTHTAANEKNALELALNFWQILKQEIDLLNKEKKMFESVQLFPMHLNETNDSFEHNAELNVSLRTPVGFDAKSLESILKEKYPYGKLKLTEHEKAARAEKNNLLVRSYLHGIRSENLNPGFKVKSGTSDFNIAYHTWKNIPILAYGPGESGLDHTPNEHIEFEEFIKSINVSKNAIKKLDILLGQD